MPIPIEERQRQLVADIQTEEGMDELLRYWATLDKRFPGFQYDKNYIVTDILRAEYPEQDPGR